MSARLILMFEIVVEGSLRWLKGFVVAQFGQEFRLQSKSATALPSPPSMDLVVTVQTNRTGSYKAKILDIHLELEILNLRDTFLILWSFEDRLRGDYGAGSLTTSLLRRPRSVHYEHSKNYTALTVARKTISKNMNS
jgi:hypothetical protein